MHYRVTALTAPSPTLAEIAAAIEAPIKFPWAAIRAIPFAKLGIYAEVIAGTLPFPGPVKDTPIPLL